MFIKYIFHKNQKCAPQMGVNIYKVTSISKNENFEILNDMNWVSLEPK